MADINCLIRRQNKWELTMRTQSLHCGSCAWNCPSFNRCTSEWTAVFVCLTLTLTHESCSASKQRVQRIHNVLTEGKQQPLIIISNISKQLERTRKTANLHIWERGVREYLSKSFLAKNIWLVCALIHLFVYNFFKSRWNQAIKTIYVLFLVWVLNLRRCICPLAVTVNWRNAVDENKVMYVVRFVFFLWLVNAVTWGHEWQQVNQLLFVDDSGEKVEVTGNPTQAWLL